MGRKRQNTGIGRRIAIIAVIVVVLAALLYIAGVVYFKGHFFIGTQLNGVNCSLKSVSGAEEKITDVVKNFEITVKDKEEAAQILKGSEFNMDVVFDDSINRLLSKQNSFLWFLSLSKKNVQSIGVTVEYDKQKLDKQVLALKCANRTSVTEPVDATISYNEDKKQFEPVEEKAGNKVDMAKLKKAAQECVESLNKTLSMEEMGCYVAPNYTKDSPEVKQALEEANKYIGVEVTYDYGTDKVVVGSEQIAPWIKVKKNLKVTFYQDKVQEYVSNMAAKYDTIYTSRKFRTSYGKEITISQGDYGWWTNRVAECKDLIRFIKEGKSGTKEPIYYQKAVQRGEDDMGDTYVEVNLTRQHVLLYKNGKKISESDCVTGKDSSPTPTGVFSVTYKDHTYEGHQVQLVGENYASKVNFFIPFSGNVGLHDASWRQSFGGTQYKNGGSHGCVNLPYSMASSIYDNIEKGMPVIVYTEN